MRHRLEMQYPSSWWHDMWREGLAVGNGVTGANLYGGAKREILQLCRHDLWYNGSEEEVPDVHEAFLSQREKMDAGRFYEASWEIVNALKEKGYTSRLEAHLPAAMLTVEQAPIRGFRGFRRWLDMERALACQQWRDGPAVMYREVFVSRKEDVAVYRLRAEREGKSEEDFSELLDYVLELKAYCNEGETTKDAMKAVWEQADVRVVCEEERRAYLYFHTYRAKSDGTAGGFGAVARIALSDGRLTGQGNTIRLRAASQVLITIGLYVDEEKEEAWRRLHDMLEVKTGRFDVMLSESAAIHGRLYHSAELSLGTQEEIPGRTNEELVMEAFSDRQPVELIEKLWHYGRYLFLCGSSPDANPFPLYGLWGGRYQPQWCHNMANENLQMIYWHSMTGNLTEYNRAVFRYMNDRIPAFRKNARRLFGIDGIYMTAGTTPGVSSPTQVVPVIINWVGAAGWIAQQYYRYFLYTRDMEYAREVMLPYMDGVAAFYEEFVRFTPDGDGGERIKLYPSVSPENTPLNFMPPEGQQMAHPMPTTINSTIDLAIYKEFFTNMLEIAGLWEKPVFPQERVDRWRRILHSIPEYKVNGDGAIKEWQEDCFADRYEHRHLSHIYPVFPGYELYPGEEPERAAAYERAVRLRRIDAQTGWSMAHMAAIYARLRDGEAAMECLDNMARSCLLNNFFTLHNDWRGMNISLNMDPAPVQLDAIMGYVNAVQEMLLYTAPGYIALLPAVKERLSVGEVKDFRYSDGLIRMKWNRGKKEFTCEITPLRAHRVRILLPDFAGQATVRYSGAVKVAGPEEGRLEVEFLEVETSLNMALY